MPSKIVNVRSTVNSDHFLLTGGGQLLTPHGSAKKLNCQIVVDRFSDLITYEPAVDSVSNCPDSAEIAVDSNSDHWNLIEGRQFLRPRLPQIVTILYFLLENHNYIMLIIILFFSVLSFYFILFFIYFLFYYFLLYLNHFQKLFFVTSQPRMHWVRHKVQATAVDSKLKLHSWYNDGHSDHKTATVDSKLKLRLDIMAIDSKLGSPQLRVSSNCILINWSFWPQEKPQLTVTQTDLVQRWSIWP